jgi:hypothetical protein
LTVCTLRSRFGDPDTWWHLRTGQFIWQTRSVPSVDPFSFTAAGKPWVAQEWLAQLSLYAAWSAGGYQGLQIWSCVLAAAMLLGGYFLCWRRCRDPLTAFLGAMGIWFFSTIGLVARPHLAGYLLLIATMLVMEAGRTADSRWYFALPPLFALWINLHSSFILGIAVVLIGLIGCCFDFRAGLLECHRAPLIVRRRLMLSLLLSIIALLVNPVGPRLVWYPIDVMLHQHLNLGFTTEWQPMAFSDARAWALPAVAGLILLTALLKRSVLCLDELALLTAGFLFAAQHGRMLFVFGIFAMPILCRLLAAAPARSRKEHPAFNAVLLGMIACGVWVALPDEHTLRTQVETHVPAAAVDFIERNHLQGPLLNEYGFGGYLIWRMPERRVFIDGRADVYEPAGVLAEYLRWATATEDPHLLLNRYGIQVCLLPQGHPLSHVIPLLAGWKQAYADSVAIVFVRQTGPPA